VKSSHFIKTYLQRIGAPDYVYTHIHRVARVTDFVTNIFALAALAERELIVTDTWCRLGTMPSLTYSKAFDFIWRMHQSDVVKQMTICPETEGTFEKISIIRKDPRGVRKVRIYLGFEYVFHCMNGTTTVTQNGRDTIMSSDNMELLLKWMDLLPPDMQHELCRFLVWVN
jgi:hypothetical protein